VNVVCCAGRGLCVGPIPRPEYFYRVLCVLYVSECVCVVCVCVCVCVCGVSECVCVCVCVVCLCLCLNVCV